MGPQSHGDTEKNTLDRPARRSPAERGPACQADRVKKAARPGAIDMRSGPGRLLRRPIGLLAMTRHLSLRAKRSNLAESPAPGSEDSVSTSRRGQVGAGLCSGSAPTLKESLFVFSRLDVRGTRRGADVFQAIGRSSGIAARASVMCRDKAARWRETGGL